MGFIFRKTIKIVDFENWTNLLLLAEEGNNIAQYEVASYYHYGLIIGGVEIVQENKSTALKWYYESYNNGNIEAAIRIADFLSEGIYCELNIEIATQLYQKGISNGSGLAANNLAIIYRDKEDYKKVFELYKVAQGFGKSNALTLALCYYFGVGTEKSLEDAFEISLKISKDSSEFNSSRYEVDEANYLLGKIYLEGKMAERSIQKARHFLELADRDNDHHSAQELLLIIGRS